MSIRNYSILVLAVTAATLASVALAVPAAAETRTAILLGAALAAVNTLAAHALVRWSDGRSTKAFLGAVLGGMVGRLSLLLAAVVVAVVGFGLPRLPLVVSLLGYFALFMVMELTLQHRSHARAAETR